MKRLYLYGPPASGKSTLAKRLSREFKIESADLDERIVAKTGMSIPDFFARFGEARFREIEAETLKEIASPIVALGGGALLDEESRAFAEKNGFVAFLDVEAETIAKRIECEKGSRPLGNMLHERREHYASFHNRIYRDTRVVLPCRLAGEIKVPLSKSSLHRLLIASFLASRDEGFLGWERFCDSQGDCDDISATKRTLEAISKAIRQGDKNVDLDCGESGSTLRFLAPICAALGLKANFIRRGRLAERPSIDYGSLEPGEYFLRGDISSQFVTGLLFALPLLDGDSRISFSSPLESRGYVDMTLDTIRRFGIVVEESDGVFLIPGRQTYRTLQTVSPEADWSSAAFWIAANSLGANIDITNLSCDSAQPDRVAAFLADKIASGPCEIDISPCPDLYPALAIVAAASNGETKFLNASRLRIKESDRIAAMERVLAAFGVDASSNRDTSLVRGIGEKFDSCEIDCEGDHRIAMAAAIGAIRSNGPVLIHRASAVAKSYPRFFEDYVFLARGGAED